jgi:hypothetical protein
LAREGWLATEPQITALAIVHRLAAIDPGTFGDKRHSIVQRLLKALRRNAAERGIAETATAGGEAKIPNTRATSTAPSAIVLHRLR